MNTPVTVGTSSTRVVVANPRRRLLIVTNNSDTDMYISLGAVAISTYGIPIKASGGSLTLEKTRPGEYIYTGEVTAISAVDAKVLSVCEIDD